jgi:putative resolvase
MKRSEWARKQGISYQTAWCWVRQGKIQIPFEQTPTGTILVKEPKATSQAVAPYARRSARNKAKKSPGDHRVCRFTAPTGMNWT